MTDTSWSAGFGNIGKTAAESALQPLSTMQTVQSLLNSQQYNKNMQQELLNSQLSNQQGQSNLANDMLTRHNKMLFAYNNLSDAQLQGGAPLLTGLQQEVDNKVIDPQRAAVYKAQIDAVTAAGGDRDGSLYRPLLSRAISMNMDPAQAVQYLQGSQKTATNPDGTSQEVLTPGAGAAPGTPTRNLGTPYGGGMSPAEGTDVVSMPNTTGGTDYYLRRQLSPTGQPRAGEQPQRSTATPSGAPDGGTQTAQNLPTPARTVSPLPARQLQNDNELYNGVLKNTAPVNQDISDLTEAYNLVKGLSTSGKGLDWVNQHRAEIVSWAKRFNVDPGALNTEDSAYDLANKILTRVQMNAPGAGSSVVALETAGSATPNLGHMNHDAALSAMRDLIGQRRQYIASAMDYADKSGGGFSEAQPKYFTSTDRTGFASDVMTEPEVKEYVKHLGGRDSERGKAFLAGLQITKRLFNRDIGDSLIK